MIIPITTQPATPADMQLVTAIEMRKRLKIGKRTFLDGVEVGTIPCVVIGRVRRYHPKTVFSKLIGRGAVLS